MPCPGAQLDIVLGRVEIYHNFSVVKCVLKLKIRKCQLPQATVVVCPDVASTGKKDDLTEEVMNSKQQ